MKAKLRQDGKWTFIEFKGRMDTFTYTSLVDQIQTLLRMGKRFLVFDLKETEFINFASLYYLRKVAKNLQETGGELLFLNPNVELRENIDAFRSFENNVCSSSDLQRKLQNEN